MTSNSNEKFWLENPVVLFTNFCKFSPFNKITNKTFAKNMNSYTRLILIIILVLFAITKNINYVLIGIFLIVIIIIFYYSFKKDSFDDISSRLNYEKLPLRKSDYFDVNKAKNNPLKNVPQTEFDKYPKYLKSTNSNSDMTKYINGKMFQTAEQYIFDKETRQYYTMPNTSEPNDQTAFANWLYGTENICKEGSIYMHKIGTPEQTLNCNGFNTSQLTNFGNLND